MKKGKMPNTDFTYEEFEDLLASYFLSLLPLCGSSNICDRRDFKAALRILNGFAKRHDVLRPTVAAQCLRRAKNRWGMSKKFDSCFTLLDMMNSFWRDFGVGGNPKEIDERERCKLGRLLIGIMHRHGILKARFEVWRGKKIAVGVESWAETGKDQPLT